MKKKTKHQMALELWKKVEKARANKLQTARAMKWENYKFNVRKPLNDSERKDFFKYLIDKAHQIQNPKKYWLE